MGDHELKPYSSDHPSMTQRFLHTMRKWANSISGPQNFGFGVFFLFIVALICTYILVVVTAKIGICLWRKGHNFFLDRIPHLGGGWRDLESGGGGSGGGTPWPDDQERGYELTPLENVSAAEDRHQNYYRPKVLTNLRRNTDTSSQSVPPSYESAVEDPQPVHVAATQRHTGLII